MSQLPISYNGPQEQPGNRKPLTFLHCPTRRDLKGTSYIIQAIKELRDKGYNLSLYIVEKQPHAAVLHAMQEADVIIDQLLIGWYGMVSVEAWALRKPVICYIRPDLYEEYHPPVCIADPATIKDAIKELYNFPETRLQWAERGREYVERIHDIRNLDIGY